MEFKTNDNKSIEVRDLEHPMHFVNKCGDALTFRMYNNFFIIEYAEVQYRYAKSKAPEMLIGTNKIDDHD